MGDNREGTHWAGHFIITPSARPDTHKPCFELWTKLCSKGTFFGVCIWGHRTFPVPCFGLERKGRNMVITI